MASKAKFFWKIGFQPQQNQAQPRQKKKDVSFNIGRHHNDFYSGRFFLEQTFPYATQHSFTVLNFHFSHSGTLKYLKASLRSTCN